MYFKKLKVGFALLLVLSFSLTAEAKTYRGVLNHWTHSKEWFSTQTFQANIIWHATWFAPEFRKAFAQRHIKRKYLNPLEAANYLADQEQRGSEVEEFFLGLYARKPYRHLSLGKDSFWEVVLVTEAGQVLKPASVEEVDVTPYEEAMFPYLNRWTKAYRVTFPKVGLGFRFKLALRSVIGENSVTWESQPLKTR